MSQVIYLNSVLQSINCPLKQVGGMAPHLKMGNVIYAIEIKLGQKDTICFYVFFDWRVYIVCLPFNPIRAWKGWAQMKNVKPEALN